MLMTDGKITKKGLDQLRSRVGVDLRIRQYNDEASKDAIRQFASGIGDPNPMWHDPGHGFKSTRFGTMIAPPTFLYSVLVPTGALAGGLPGVHSFFGGNDWSGTRQSELMTNSALRLNSAMLSRRTIVKPPDVVSFNT